VGREGGWGGGGDNGEYACTAPNPPTHPSKRLCIKSLEIVRGHNCDSLVTADTTGGSLPVASAVTRLSLTFP